MKRVKIRLDKYRDRLLVCLSNKYKLPDLFKICLAAYCSDQRVVFTLNDENLSEIEYKEYISKKSNLVVSFTVSDEIEKFLNDRVYDRFSSAFCISIVKDMLLSSSNEFLSETKTANFDYKSMYEQSGYYIFDMSLLEKNNPIFSGFNPTLEALKMLSNRTYDGSIVTKKEKVSEDDNFENAINKIIKEPQVNSNIVNEKPHPEKKDDKKEDISDNMNISVESADLFFEAFSKL